MSGVVADATSDFELETSKTNWREPRTHSGAAAIEGQDNSHLISRNILSDVEYSSYSLL